MHHFFSAELGEVPIKNALSVSQTVVKICRRSMLTLMRSYFFHCEILVYIIKKNLFLKVYVRWPKPNRSGMLNKRSRSGFSGTHYSRLSAWRNRVISNIKLIIRSLDIFRTGP